MLQIVGTPVTTIGFGSITQNVPNGPAPCNIFANEAENTTGVDGSAVVLFDNIYTAHAMKTYTVQYKGI